MSLMSCMKRAILITFTLSVFATPLSAAEKEKPHWSDQQLKSWLGRKINVDYVSCSSTGCMVVRSAMLKEVKKDAIIVIVNGAPFYIPKYMLKTVELAK